MSSRPWTRALKAVHVAGAGLWLGGTAAILTLLRLAPEGTRSFATDLAAYRIQNGWVFLAFVITLVTGLVYSLFTPWGFLRYRWVTTKWLLAIALFVLTLGWQSGALAGRVGLADAGVSDLGRDLVYDDLRSTALWTAGAQLTVVVAVFFVSTFKPWGRWSRSFDVARRKVLVGVGIGLSVAAAAGVSNACVLRRYRAMEIPMIDPARLPDGRYSGVFTCDTDYEVALTVRAGEIVDADVVRSRESRYARLAQAVLPRIVAAQSPAVDAITGATTTSKCLMRAAAQALESQSSRVSSPAAPETRSREDSAAD